MNTGRALLFEAMVAGPLKSAPGRTLLAVVVIALGVALGLSVTLVNRSAADEVSLAARSLFGLADLIVEGPAQGFDEALYPAVARLPGVALASPVVDVEARLADGSGTLRVLGIDFFRAPRMQPAIGLEAPRTNLAVLAADTVFLSPAAARDLALEPDDALVLQSGLEPLTFRVGGILPAGAFRQRAVLLDIGTAQWRFGQSGVLQRIEIRLASGASPEAVSAAIRALAPAGISVRSPGAATDEALRLSRAYRANLTALALVALFTGAFLVHATQSLGVMKRRREIAFLHAIGVTPREVVGGMLASGLLVGAVGSALGVVAGFLIAGAGLDAFGGDLGAGYFRGLEPGLSLSIADASLFFVLGTAAAAGGSVHPALEAASVPAAAALKAGDVATSSVRGHVAAGLVLWMVAGGLLALPPVDGLPLAGYAAIALILTGAVMLMPGVIRILLRGLPATRSVPWQIALSRLKGTTRQATTSLAAILVSFSLMVAMAVMVTSFRTSLDLWLEKILPADLYLRTGFASETAYLGPGELDVLRALPGVARIEPNRFAELALDAAPAPLALIARPIAERDADRTLWLEAVADAPPPPGAIPLWISEAAADLTGLEPGAEFTASLSGRDAVFSVRGIYRDYERQNGSVILDREAYLRLTGDERVNAVWFWVEDGVDVDGLAARVREELPTLGASDLRQPGEIRALSLRVFDRTFAVTYLLEFIAVLIGLAGIAASMSAGILARRAELGMLRHLGLTRGQTGIMLGAEGALLGATGVVAGLVVGTAVSLVLIYVVNRQSFHWSMDVYFPHGLLVVLSCTLIASAALAAVVSGRIALRDDVVRAVKEDW